MEKENNEKQKNTQKKDNQKPKQDFKTKKDNKEKQTLGNKELLLKIKKLEKELTKSQKESNSFLIEINKLEIEKQKNIQDFHNKAQNFSKKAQEEIDKFKKEYLVKKEKQIEDDKKYALQKLFESIIDPLNNIYIAIASGKEQGEQVKPYVQGFEMLLDQLFGELQHFGLKIIDPHVGHDYDHELHKAISIEKGSPNKILKVVKRGFIFKDRVIEPAVVIIGK